MRAEGAGDAKLAIGQGTRTIIVVEAYASPPAQRRVGGQTREHLCAVCLGVGQQRDDDPRCRQPPGRVILEEAEQAPKSAVDLWHCTYRQHADGDGVEFQPFCDLAQALRYR